MMLKTGRGFRVALDSNPSQRKGIFATDLADLRAKTIERFKLGKSAKTLSFYLEDFTEVEDDEYFDSIPGLSIIIVEVSGNAKMKKSAHVPDPENIFDHVLSMLRWSGGVDTVYQQVLEFMKQDFPAKYRQIHEGIKLEQISSDKAKLSSRKEDPDWFADLNTGAKTKEEFMFRNSQSRIRGYLSRAETQLKELTGEKEAELIANVVSEFRQMLKTNSYHGDLFARTAAKSQRICDANGLFKCEGRYEETLCSYIRGRGDTIVDVHEINPYASRENRILFSTWNLDHVIERSRTIVPSLVEAIHLKKSKKKCSDLNLEYFYNLLFTRLNLKLVHIVCHDKQQHSSKQCDPNQYFR